MDLLFHNDDHSRRNIPSHMSDCFCTRSNCRAGYCAVDRWPSFMLCSTDELPSSTCIEFTVSSRQPISFTNCVCLQRSMPSRAHVSDSWTLVYLAEVDFFRELSDSCTNAERSIYYVDGTKDFGWIFRLANHQRLPAINYTYQLYQL